MSEQNNSPLNPSDSESAGGAPGELPRELKSLEARFAALVPRNDRLDRERLMFLAGQASADATKQRPMSLLGLSLDATVWPRAFAAMTAIAATLFVMLFTRPSATDVSSPSLISSIANGNRPFESQSHALNDSASPRANVLSAGDACNGNIEQMLATRAEEYAGTLPVDDRDRPTLTPAAWRQVIGDAESLGLPTNKSSNLPIFRGVNS